MDALGEDEIVARLVADLPTATSVRVGPGDDCAVVDSARSGWCGLLKTDCICEGVHFLSDTPGESVGRKAMARTISDFAAMGAAEPQYALVTLVIAGDSEVSRIEAVYAGIRKCAETFGIAVVGGETSRTSGPSLLSICMTGEIPENALVLRSGAQVGDAIFVTGLLGGSIRGKHLHFIPRLAEARWLAQAFRPSAMMDLSDGLAKDLPRLARASGVGFQLDFDQLPCSPECTPEQAMSDGEDYELLFTIPEAVAEPLQDNWRSTFPSLSLTRIGTTVLSSQSQSIAGGWDHFAPPT